MNSEPTRKQLLLGAGHLLALWSLTFVQPLLDLLGKNPDFFVARGNGVGDILILAIGFTLLPPLAMFAIEAATARFSPRAYNWLHLLLLAGMMAFLAIQIISGFTPGPTILILAAAGACGAAFAWLVHRSRFLRNLLDLLIITPVVILAIFVFSSSTSELIFPDGSKTTVSDDSGRDRPIVLIVFDELGTSDLMTDRSSIAAQRYPNFARLSREGTWYKNNSTTDFFTPRAVPGILTGKQLANDALPTVEDQPDNIFTRLGGDRPLHVMEPITALCPDDLCSSFGREESRLDRLSALWSDLAYVEGHLVLPPGLAARLPDVSANFAGFGGGKTGETDPFFVKGLALGGPPDTYRQFIREIPESNRGLTVMHLLVPHQPWIYTAEGRAYNPWPVGQLFDSTGEEWLVDSAGIATAQARMYTQTGLADRMIGWLRQSLKSKGLWDDAIVVVTADHGTSFEGDGVARRKVDERAMGEVANTPLFVKYPGQKRGGAVDIHSTTLDILPTIARAVGVKDEAAFDGVPLQGPVPDRPVSVTDIKNGGDIVSVSLDQMIAQRDAAIARANRRLGKGPLYTLGPRPGLIGRTAPPIPAGADSASLDEPRLWDAVRRDEGTIPISITGTLGRNDPGSVVAVAVNGVVRGTATAFEFDGKVRFEVLVDPASLKEGRNRIGLYLSSGAELTPLGGNG